MIIRTRRQQRGQIILIFALAAVALFGVAGLAVDGGRALMDQRNLQNAVDGASLTGANDLGPGTDAQSQANALDDVVYSLEQSLSISFSAKYGGLGHRLLGGECGGFACNSASPAPGPGPFNASDAASPCCVNWLDSTGQYTLNITTPLNYGGTTEPEAFIKVDLVHQLPVLIAGSLVPNINVHVQATARNYALPYAIFTFKWNDPNAINENGRGGLTATKRIGTNGSDSQGSGLMTFTCPGGKYGGDLWTLRAVPATPITVGSYTDTASCVPPGLPSSLKPLSRPVVVPNMHLPDDPCIGSTAANCTGAWATPLPAITVSATSMLQPTRSSIPGGPIGPRYTSVSVTAGQKLYLQPGVYYFEGTLAASGLLVQASGATVATGECYGVTPPTGCDVQTNHTICGASLPYANAATPGAPSTFPCTANYDFGVLLVFWPAGTDVACTENQYPAASGNYFCDQGTSPMSGNLNTIQLLGGGIFYVSSSTMYHNVAVYVNPKHASGTTMNFTITAALSAGFSSYCTANFSSLAKCMASLGNGSHVVDVNGGSNTSIIGAMFAPQDCSFLGGASGGKGYGQILNYFIHFQGSGAINENYNPLALAYSPVLVQ
jgi:hypothetical protein